ncbi:dTDP-4-dehydrorhamnose reductase [Noviherbaspirillum humi]|uniref:dTDP-4-dehydrorhamnose reductase n=1 Tax=Noviherbaspirillum humi TaxID=1688639 RepID=A0A239DN42_9BURK|nr:family 1 glycosylhydrolase [Noviherbaspirillum humi]SNS33074.1 dTDP-4-dehydrorhamnose reductase [Noviherbaspirillum humi]
MPTTSPQRSLELWGGLECTVVRIQDSYRNQIEETGHHRRLQDLDAIAALGIRTLRYPVLWETVAPDRPEACDWRWHDARLQRLRELGIAPIAGLVHHGSGPRYTSLLDPAFPDLLARHAERVAQRYPWITRFTPVNEPLTTARFSALYGHWYPHGRDVATMLRALYHECRGTLLAMRAIRRVTPEAQLIQTEDMGKVFSMPNLRHQADYENERRWLSFDLLCGRIDRRHSWHQAFLEAGISEAQLAEFVDAPCAPDIIGINHYLTSERFLDRRIRDYPEPFHPNGHPRYVDVQAVRVPQVDGLTGPDLRLREVWERYRLPIAVTEVHHGGARDDQLRWLKQVWDAAAGLKQEGVDMRAVTVWSLLGCVDWNSLLIERNGFYESGAFDVRCDPPRATAVAGAVKSLAHTGDFDHPALDGLGWWQRDDRYLAPVPREGEPRVIRTHRKLLITGSTGTLGRAFARICESRHLQHELLGRADMDIADPASVQAALLRHRPWAVINTAGYVRVADAAKEPERCFRENSVGAEVLAKACAELGIPYVTFSSDLVFDGSLGRPYVESDAVAPVGIYGQSKAEAERRVLQACPDHALVIRTSAFFGPWDRHNFVHLALREVAAGRPFEASDGVMVSPTYVPDLVHSTLDLVTDHEKGIWHLANPGMVSWYEFARQAAQQAGLDPGLVRRSADAGRAVTALSSERGLILPGFTNALQRYFRENTLPWEAQEGSRAVA